MSISNKKRDFCPGENNKYNTNKPKPHLLKVAFLITTSIFAFFSFP